MYCDLSLVSASKCQHISVLLLAYIYFTKDLGKSLMGKEKSHEFWKEGQDHEGTEFPRGTLAPKSEPKSEPRSKSKPRSGLKPNRKIY